MTVAELIDELQTMDQNKQVMIDTDDTWEPLEMVDDDGKTVNLIVRG